jgi:hypothetical protein
MVALEQRRLISRIKPQGANPPAFVLLIVGQSAALFIFYHL